MDAGAVFAINQLSTCVGDCDDTGAVTIHELLTMVDIALGSAAVSECRAGDSKNDGGRSRWMKSSRR
ncbi:MAG: hypothetical protein A3J75_06730 [Acidobacteria bacterium RBG_16_68_9]|nr:MAG: hypothetical protein A3J75_06730 [Acidobacteria bacterium RBG_16_68_9]